MNLLNKILINIKSDKQKSERLTEIQNKLNEINQTKDYLIETRDILFKSIDDSLSIKEEIENKREDFMGDYVKSMAQFKFQERKLNEELENIEKSHKYISKKPDGKGGFEYEYFDKKNSTGAKNLGNSGKFIEKTNTNPAQTYRGIKKYLDENGFKYDFNFAVKTSSRYIETEDKLGNRFSIRLANHSKAKDYSSFDSGIKVTTYRDGELNVDIDSSLGYKAKDISNIIELTGILSEELNKVDLSFKPEDVYGKQEEDIISNKIKEIGFEDDFYHLTNEIIKDKLEDFKNSKNYINYKEQKQSEIEERTMNGIFDIKDAKVSFSKNKINYVDVSEIKRLSGSENKERRERVRDFIQYDLGNKFTSGEINYSKFYKECDRAIKREIYGRSTIQKSILDKISNTREVISSILRSSNNSKDKDLYKSLTNIKNLYKSRKIGLIQYNDILKSVKKEENTKYADVIVLNREGEILLLKRSDFDSTHSGAYVIPGGHIDLGEDCETAAKRELVEESGLSVDNLMNNNNPFKPLWSKLGEYEDENCHIDYFLLQGVEINDFELILQESEIREYQWVNRMDIDEYKMVFNMKDNIKQLLGWDNQPSIEVIKKAIKQSLLSPNQVNRIVKALRDERQGHKYTKRIVQSDGKNKYIHNEEKITHGRNYNVDEIKEINSNIGSEFEIRDLMPALEQLIPVYELTDRFLLMIKASDLGAENPDCLCIDFQSRTIQIDSLGRQLKFNPFTPINNRTDDLMWYYRNLLHRKLNDEDIVRALIEFDYEDEQIEKAFHTVSEMYLEGLVPDETFEKAEAIYFEKSLNQSFRSKAHVGEVRKRKDGTKWKKVTEGKGKENWQQVKEDGSEIQDKENDKTSSKNDNKGVVTKEKHTTKELTALAQETSENALNNAIKQSPDPDVRETAHKELERRQEEEKYMGSLSKKQHEDLPIEDFREDYKGESKFYEKMKSAQQIEDDKTEPKKESKEIKKSIWQNWL